MPWVTRGALVRVQAPVLKGDRDMIDREEKEETEAAKLGTAVHEQHEAWLTRAPYAIAFGWAHHAIEDRTAEKL
jgi:hypothetical protein